MLHELKIIAEAAYHRPERHPRRRTIYAEGEVCQGVVEAVELEGRHVKLLGISLFNLEWE
jgi:hypothetical protein